MGAGASALPVERVWGFGALQLYGLGGFGVKLLSEPDAPIEERVGGTPGRGGETEVDACVQSHRPGFRDSGTTLFGRGGWGCD